jgi:hypothetical protein
MVALICFVLAVLASPFNSMSRLEALRNHAPDIAAMDLFVVPTIGFKLLYGFVILRLHRRDLVWINVTTNPDSGVRCMPNHRGISLGWGSALYDPRPRSDLRHRCHTPISRHGHPR